MLLSTGRRRAPGPRKFLAGFPSLQRLMGKHVGGDYRKPHPDPGCVPSPPQLIRERKITVKNQLLLVTVLIPAYLMAQECKQGYVWREARSGDRVCVTPEVRARTSEDNRQAASRRSPTNRQYGPDTCRDGYVWRGAWENDHVCVSPDVRDQAQRDNAAMVSRRAPPPPPVPIPQECQQGYVWREARSGDRVCVTPEVRARTSEDNRQAASRRSPTNRQYGPDTCRDGYVWRGAWENDHVCVSPDVRDQAQRDNAAMMSR